MVLVGCMLLVALVINPLLVWWKIRRNPFPLVLTCLRESGVYAFFTRSFCGQYSGEYGVM